MIVMEVRTMAVAKMNRIDLRISQTDKETLELAAASKRISLSSYILSVAIERATDDLEKERKLTLSQDGWNQIMDLLDNPPKANQALKDLMKQ
ncbi:MAG: DUF1778 domain-containing protein [Erysipelotrichaceae bacterium]|jgi:uncharacterized protein (DUF1778 family)|nr:DUF1778 domain-containing protein [Erysipelotrichaceae bacterium]